MQSTNIHTTTSTAMIQPGTGDEASLVLSHFEDDGILILTLNDPKRRNPLSVEMIQTLQNGLDDAEANVAIKVIILNAEGPVFSAGHDLKQMNGRRSDEDKGKAYFQDVMTQCSALMQSIVTHRCPVIAAIEGTATAAGCQLVASCDLAVASNTSKFSTPGVNIGLFCSTPMIALSRNVPRKQAMEMLLTGDFVDAERAQQIGLINRMSDQGEALNDALALARQIASKSPLTVKTGKQAFYKQVEMPLDEAYTYAVDVMVENMLFRDAQEGITAFLEKRQPQWQGE